MASSRLPDKPLANLAGVPMVVRVAHRAKESAATRVVVATDDERVITACHLQKVEAIMTRSDHLSGSDRLAEACDILQLWSMSKGMNP
jgi:3-deoxy-manno-octulosonate cytidylyltransferase (CMP-KDO synthetase)